ncbi:hypothetical protein B0H14DRAFT_3853307 [Mycena olivaceomarginata]|nr:hypothetical protein B0H14DRAFT_3853307 [Mycena olivaceomarginata]
MRRGRTLVNPLLQLPSQALAQPAVVRGRPGLTRPRRSTCPTNNNTSLTVYRTRSRRPETAVTPPPVTARSRTVAVMEGKMLMARRELGTATPALRDQPPERLMKDDH